MSGAFSPSAVRLGGLVRKIPWKMNDGRKANVRKRMKEVDSVIGALSASGVRIKALDKALTLPREDELTPKDKYTTFVRSAAGYRKSIHKISHFTKKTFRVNPHGF